MENPESCLHTWEWPKGIRLVAVAVVLNALLMAWSYHELALRGEVGAASYRKFTLERLPSPTPFKHLPEKLEKSFEEHLKIYRLDLENFQSNLLYQFIFMMLTYLVVAGNVLKFKFPGVDIEVENNDTISLVVCSCLLFLWLKFGFLSSAILDERFRLHSMAVLLDRGRIGTLGQAFPGVESWSVMPMIADGGIFDAWFTVNTPVAWQATDLPGGVIIMVMAGLFLGVSNGCTLGLAWRACYRSPNLWRKLVLAAVTVFLLVTHSGFFGMFGLLGFAEVKRNENWMQLISMLTALLILRAIHRTMVNQDALQSRTPDEGSIALAKTALRDLATELAKQLKT